MGFVGLFVVLPGQLPQPVIGIGGFLRKSADRMGGLVPYPLLDTFDVAGNIKGVLVYLAIFLDIYSRKIIGWSMDTSMKEKLVTDAFFLGILFTGPI